MLRTSQIVLRTIALCAITAPVASHTLAAQTAAPANAAPSVRLTGPQRWADSARRIIDKAVTRNDSLALQQSAALIDRALTAFPDDALLLHYRGYAAYRLGQQATARKQEELADTRYQEALKWLDKAVEKNPIAESHALRAATMGQLIGGSAIRGMRYGMAAGKADDEATALGRDNPRVLLLQAVGTWFKPSMYGGGEDKARAILQRALTAFERDTPAPAMPSWGRAEALAWHGQWELKAGRAASARAAYEQALALEPEYGWVKYVLLPAVPAAR